MASKHAVLKIPPERLYGTCAPTLVEIKKQERENAIRLSINAAIAMLASLAERPTLELLAAYMGVSIQTAHGYLNRYTDLLREWELLKENYRPR